MVGLSLPFNNLIMKTMQPFLVSSISGLIVFAGQLIFSIVSGNFAVSSQIETIKNEIKLVRLDIQKERKLQNYKIDQIKVSIKSIKQNDKK